MSAVPRRCRSAHRIGDNAPVTPSASSTCTVTLDASGKRFPVRPGETVLAAAQRAGLALPYSCRAGVCGSCKATLLAGVVHYPHRPPAALSADEQAHHAMLICQAVPRSDLRIAAREVVTAEDLPRRRMTAVVSAKTSLAPDVIALRLAIPDAPPLRWLAGQYVDVLLADGGRRAFSIANAPHRGPEVELHLRRVAGGGFTSYAFDTLAPGMTLQLEGPLGTFVPREDSERPLLFVAGGTGFAPVKALIEHFLHLGTRRPIALYWGARSIEELYLRALPAQWAARHPGLRFVPVLSAAADTHGLRDGLVHEAVLADLHELAGMDVYMAGPPALIEAARRAFIAAGLPEEQLYYDSFEYAPEVLDRILRGRAGIHGL